MARSTVHYADSDTNNTLKKLHNKLRPAGTPVQRVEYIIELLLLRIFEVKLKQDQEFRQLRDLFKEPNDNLLFSCLYTVANEQLLPTINEKFFPFYAGILSHARKVYKKTNLSQKVLDQLVLIEEVFKNSNFTNNVKSGNLQEIISLVSEINEERLLKTDLLGDAIESALSETGGTKDLGLHRTPDHIRQFMVGIAAPSFSDSIHDPACGTAGFLFDSWGYVTEAIRRDGLWPGPKAHPEISAYFEQYFAGKDAPMPSAEQAISFYRSGISGTEYLGVIRKMAAINLYIRGLNPSTSAAIKNGQQKMLVHMATGLGKTRIAVALCKALLEYGLARRILFVVDRRLLAEQARDDGFSLISSTYNSAWITTSNYKTHRNKDIHIVVIDTLEIIHQGIPGNFYDLLIVDECHRSINLNRKIIFDHFLCPRIGLTATPRIAVAKNKTKVPDDDLAILDTYRLFGCESREPTYHYDIDRGIDEGFLAPYKVKEIKTHLTQMAEEEGIEFDYVLDPDERRKIELDTTKKLMLEQLNRKYLTENTAKRIAEEIRKRTEYGEKIILFGVSQAHCLMLARALNEVFNDNGSSNPRYAEPIISENQELNRALKGWFKKPYQKPYIAVSVDIMSTGVDIPCVRHIAFSALTKSVGKYIQMLGRGTRLDPKTGKFSFQVFDFVGLCKRMEDNGKGSPKENKKVVKGGDIKGGGGGGTGVKGEWFIVDNPDPYNLIQRVCVHEGAVEIIDNIPIEEAKKIFEGQVKDTDNPNIVAIKKKLKEKEDYEPSPKDIDNVIDFIRKPQIYMDEGQLQKIYDYPGGTAWDFFLHVLGIKLVPTPLERIKKGYESYIASSVFNDEQVRALRKIKDIFASSINNYGKIDMFTIFGNPVYESIIGNFDSVNALFEDKLNEVIEEMAQAFCMRKAA